MVTGHGQRNAPEALDFGGLRIETDRIHPGRRRRLKRHEFERMHPMTFDLAVKKQSMPQKRECHSRAE